MTTLTSPDDLLIAVPFLVGYHPENSLVLISLCDGNIGMAMRIDFPRDADPDQMDSLASHLVREKADAAMVVAYLPNEISDCEYLMAPLTEAIEMRDIAVREFLQVHQLRWRSLICSDKSCCPPGGSPLPDINNSRVAAEQVLKGRRLPYVDLEHLKDSMTSFPPNEKLKRKIEKVAKIDYESTEVIDKQREGALAVTDLFHQFRTLGSCSDEGLIALVLVRLQDLQVRDYAMGITDSEKIDLLASMWLWLVKTAPIGYVAPVATLLAATAYENGDGAFAARALDRAFEDDLTYPLAKLLRRVFAAGWPPESFAQMRADLHPRICATLFAD
ncbi:MAG: DUF4192 domain-containing protein [Actinomycetes bacterium]